jgi:hypothetical protein
MLKINGVEHEFPIGSYLVVEGQLKLVFGDTPRNEHGVDGTIDIRHDKKIAGWLRYGRPNCDEVTVNVLSSGQGHKVWHKQLHQLSHRKHDIIVTGATKVTCQLT